mmetsp:Transcript_77258/g.179153  ORF Transcript_77258/g.179153 Transcript_77258/m.179153 type:complete len:277 (+) Transcript_77258:1025-1855(+)
MGLLLAGQTGQTGMATGWKKARGSPLPAGIAAMYQPFCTPLPLPIVLVEASMSCVTSPNRAKPSPGTTFVFHVGNAHTQWQGWQLSMAPSLLFTMVMEPESPVSFSSLHSCSNNSELWSRRCRASCCTLGQQRTSCSWPTTTAPSFKRMCKGAWRPFKSIAEGNAMRTSGGAPCQSSSHRDSRMAFHARRSSATYRALRAAGIDGGVKPWHDVAHWEPSTPACGGTGCVGSSTHSNCIHSSAHAAAPGLCFHMNCVPSGSCRTARDFSPSCCIFEK